MARSESFDDCVWEHHLSTSVLVRHPVLEKNHHERVSCGLKATFKRKAEVIGQFWAAKARRSHAISVERFVRSVLQSGPREWTSMTYGAPQVPADEPAREAQGTNGASTKQGPKHQLRCGNWREFECLESELEFQLQMGVPSSKDAEQHSPNLVALLFLSGITVQTMCVWPAIACYTARLFRRQSDEDDDNRGRELTQSIVIQKRKFINLGRTMSRSGAAAVFPSTHRRSCDFARHFSGWMDGLAGNLNALPRAKSTAAASN
ncbi:hypothetical protein EDB83DRAFT_2312739 [Lactarius deliciosus]|nr:hypothetical protein EDB83DRAFT_2312739 [Lactarius deliciosus]